MNKIIFFTIFIGCWFSSEAFARTSTSDDQAAGVIVISSTTTTALGAIGGGITTTILINNSDKKNVQVRTFLKSNQTKLQAALQLGSGEIIDDFAALLNVPKSRKKAFYRALRTRRKPLVQLSHNPTEEKVAALIKWVNVNFAT